MIHHRLMPSVITRYIIRHFLTKFLIITGGLLGLIYLITFVEMLGKFGDDRQEDIYQILYLSMAQIPPVIDKIFPFFILLATLWSLFALLKTSELIILKVSSVSLWRISKIYGITTIFITTLYVFGIMPFLTQMYQEYKFWEDNRNIVIHNIHKKIQSDTAQTIFLKADHFNNADYTLSHIQLVFIDPNSLIEKIYTAKQALYDPQKQAISFKELTALKVNEEIIPPLETLYDYTLPISLEEIHKNYKSRNVLHHVYEYPDLIADQKRQKLSTTHLNILYYSFLILPMTCALYCFIGVVSVPALYRGLKGSKNIIVAISGGILFYMLDSGLIVMAGNQSLPIAIALFTMKIVVFLLCTVIVFNKEYGFGGRKTRSLLGSTNATDISSHT